MSSKILAFKLIGGEEIVAEVLSENRGSMLTETGLNESAEIRSYTLRKPHILRFQPIGPGEVGLAFIPWTLSNPTLEKVELPAKGVLVTYSPSANVEEQYSQQTSPIVRAKQVPSQGRIST